MTVLAHIVVFVCLTVALVFFAAIRNVVPPEPKEERSSESRSDGPVLTVLGFVAAVLIIVVGMQTRQQLISVVFAVVVLKLSGFPILKILKGAKPKKRK